MAMESVSLPRDNSLEELRVVVEEKKQEAKKKFSELKKLLQISEDTTTNTLDKIYTDIREGIERNERTVTQLEQAKIALNSTLVDNNMTVLLQTTIRNFDTQIAEARNSACVVPKHILLRWKVEDLKQSIENVCEVISSTSEILPSTLQPREANIKYFESEIPRLQNLLESKETESVFLRASLAESRKELENTKLLLQQTLSNSVKVQSKEDLQTGSDVRDKQAQYSQVAAKHKQHPKYIITNLIVNGKRTPFYSLNQVDNPSDLIGELVVCRSKFYNIVVGTLKVVIPPKLKFEKTIAGIEFVDEFGDSFGSYKGTFYFETKLGCALFLPTNEVYIGYKYDESSK